jgi:hypothetical protein
MASPRETVIASVISEGPSGALMFSDFWTAIAANRPCEEIWPVSFLWKLTIAHRKYSRSVLGPQADLASLPKQKRIYRHCAADTFQRLVNLILKAIQGNWTRTGRDAVGRLCVL